MPLSWYSQVITDVILGDTPRPGSTLTRRPWRAVLASGRLQGVGSGVTLSKLILSSGAVIGMVAGCATAPDGSLRARVTDIVQPGARQEAKQASAAAQRVADDARCRQLGFKPGTDGYGNCRLQLEQILSLIHI